MKKATAHTAPAHHPHPKEKSHVATLWAKCPGCDHILYKKDLYENFKICPKCHHYLRMSCHERLEMLFDKGADGKRIFTEIDPHLIPGDPIGFGNAADVPGKHHKGAGGYLGKLEADQRKTSLWDAILCGIGTMGKREVVTAILDFNFMGGSMGSVVGEKVTRAIEKAAELKIPFVLVSASGGARMQEGILSLMQMAKTSAAMARLQAAGILSICVLCDPTTGGVTASFAMLGDLLVAEPKALIAFAGPRVIEQTLREKLPEGFQQSEFLIKHGMLDCIIDRKEMKTKLVQLLNVFAPVS